MIRTQPEVAVSSVDPTNQELAGALYRDHRAWLLGWLRRSLDNHHRA